MKYPLLSVLLSAMAAIFVGCSDDTSFTVDGSFTDGADRSISMTYYDGSAFKTSTVNSIEGSFRLSGVSPAYTFVTISDGSKPLVSLIARNGDDLSVKIDFNEPINSTAKGNDPTENYTEFVHDNAAAYIKGDASQLNEAVIRYISANPDKVESTALLTNVFISAGHEQQADSLLRLLRPETRSRALLGSFPNLLASQLDVDVTTPISSRTLPGPNGQKIRVVPRESSLTLYAFANDGAGTLDSSAIIIRELTARYMRKRLHAVELSSSPDSLTWAVKVRNDTTARYDRTWSPAVIAERQWKNLAIPTLPYFIVVDSTGNQRLRSHSASFTRDFIINYLSK